MKLTVFGATGGIGQEIFRKGWQWAIKLPRSYAIRRGSRLKAMRLTSLNQIRESRSSVQWCETRLGENVWPARKGVSRTVTRILCYLNSLSAINGGEYEKNEIRGQIGLEEKESENHFQKWADESNF